LLIVQARAHLLVCRLHRRLGLLRRLELGVLGSQLRALRREALLRGREREAAGDNHWKTVPDTSWRAGEF
jgi:hypothetical protein